MNANSATDVDKLIVVLREEYLRTHNREVFGVLKGDSPMLRDEDIEGWSIRCTRLLKLVGGDYEKALATLRRWGHI